MVMPCAASIVSNWPGGKCDAISSSFVFTSASLTSMLCCLAYWKMRSCCTIAVSAALPPCCSSFASSSLLVIFSPLTVATVFWSPHPVINTAAHAASESDANVANLDFIDPPTVNKLECRYDLANGRELPVAERVERRQFGHNRALSETEVSSSEGRESRKSTFGE